MKMVWASQCLMNIVRFNMFEVQTLNFKRTESMSLRSSEALIKGGSNSNGHLSIGSLGDDRSSEWSAHGQLMVEVSY